MTDYSELKRLAEAAIKSGTENGERWPQDDDWFEPDRHGAELLYVKAVSPTSVMALIAEIERLTIAAKYSDDVDAIPESQLQMVCYDLAVERDQLKSEVERLTADNTSLRGSYAKLGAEHAGMVRTLRKANAEIRSLRSQAATLQSDANSWQSGYDEGRRMGTKAALDDREQLRKDAERYRWLRQYTVKSLPVSGALEILDRGIDAVTSKGTKP